jgi:hypothetical protein
MKDFVRFFNETSLDDIVSGKAISQFGKQQMADINRAFDTAGDAVSQNLARRGISNSGFGINELSNIESNRAVTLSRAKAADSQNFFNQRLGFAQGNFDATSGRVGNARLGVREGLANEQGVQLQFQQARDQDASNRANMFLSLSQLAATAATAGAGGFPQSSLGTVAGQGQASDFSSSQSKNTLSLDKRNQTSAADLIKFR